MKKILAVLLAALMLLAFAACGGSGEEETTQAPAVSYEGTLSELSAKIYEASPVEFMVMAEGMPVDLADAESLNYYLGVSETENFKEVLYSESMMGSQAYSLVLAKVSDTSKIEEIKKAAFEGINTAKWICVEADQVRVVSSGDLIMLVMVDSQLGDTIADGKVDAFKTLVGELSGETLTKG